MKLVKVGCVALNQTPLDWKGNLQNILAAIAHAKREALALVCLPELCISGYGCEDMFQSAGCQIEALNVLHEVAAACNDIAVSVGLPLVCRNNLYSCACFIVHGKIVGFVAKQFLAREGIHYEPRWFRSWAAGEVSEVSIGGKPYPFGDLYFRVGDLRIGFEICEDAWAASRPGSKLASQAVDIILNPSASHFAFGKHEIRKRLVLEGSRAFSVGYLYSNLLGNEAGRSIYDGGTFIASAGELLALGRRFSYKSYELTSALIDIHATRLGQARRSFADVDVELGSSKEIVLDFTFPNALPEKKSLDIQEPFETAPSLKAEEFSRAVALGLFDYLRKSHSKGFVVSLSGGADSSALCCLVALMVQFALEELGAKEFATKLGLSVEFSKLSQPQQFIEKLLTCVYQASENSSALTKEAAETVAKNLGAKYVYLEIDALVQGYLQGVSKALSYKFSWEKDDIALQNIQARVRSPSVWLIANINKALLLATSNRSEAAVGYTTMDGDTAGGLSPLGGIDKAFLLKWLLWLETSGPHGIGALPFLKVVTSQKPSAELRPSKESQTDESDLMPYNVLDVIERFAIRDKKSPSEVFEGLVVEFSQYSRVDLRLWVERFFVLWSRNQWKRERYAPSFHLDDENLDPKTWCRFPILSGQFEKELEDLRAKLK